MFRHAGTPGLNFAFIGEAQHYHQPTDDVAHLNWRTLQHEGSCALSLARRFGDLDLTKLRGSDAVYFDLLGRVLVRYPRAWAIPLALLAALLFLGVTGLEIKRGEASPWRLAIAWLAWGLALLIVGALFRYAESRYWCNESILRKETPPEALRRLGQRPSESLSDFRSSGVLSLNGR